MLPSGSEGDLSIVVIGNFAFGRYAGAIPNGWMKNHNTSILFRPHQKHTRPWS